MSNRLAVVVVALLVGAGVYVGATAVENALTSDPGLTTNGEVVATNATMHLDRVGRPTAVGEVMNGRNEPIRDATVTVTFRGDDGRTETVTGGTILATIPAGERSPFVVRLANRTARPADLSVDVSYESSTERPYDGLVVVEDRTTGRSESQVTVAGRVENRGGEAVTADVVATFYDANGSVVGARTVPTSPRTLGPGETGGFQVRYRTLGDVPSRAGEVDHYALAVRAQPAGQS